jgi:hypothetical protein
VPKSKRSLADRLRNDWQIETTQSTSALSDIFAEEPPDLTTFVQDSKFLENPALSLDQFDFVRHFEQVLYPETYVLMVEEFGEQWYPVRYVNEMSAQWGKGAGKDHVCQISFARTANILLCLKSPQRYYELAPQTIIHMMNVAAAASQAHGVFFKPLRTVLTSTKWFADKFEGGREPGPQAQQIRFRNQVEIVSGHSSAETLEGKNLIACIADEISAFPSVAEVQQSKTGRMPAKTSDAILDMLRSSATTRFPYNFKLAQISYPRFKGDAIQQATATAKLDIEENGDQSVYYVSGPKKTWDVNPRYNKIPRISIPQAEEPIPKIDSILKDYRKNPAFARAKYECAPDYAENRAFAKPPETQAWPEPISFEYYWGLDEDLENWEKAETGELKEKPGWQVRFHFSPDFYPIRGTGYALHGDMAITGDRAGVAMSHVRAWERRVWTKADGTQTLEARPIIKNDFVTSFEADAAAMTPEGKVVPREVQIRWYRKLIFELIRRNFAVQFCSFDRFASADTIQILESRGIESDRFSTDTTNVGWDTLRDCMYDGRLEGYWREIVVNEIRTLNILPNGKIDHPPGGSKDEADALAGSVVGAISLGGDETDTPERADQPAGDEYLIKATGQWADMGLGNSDFGLQGTDFGLGRF